MCLAAYIPLKVSHLLESSRKRLLITVYSFHYLNGSYPHYPNMFSYSHCTNIGLSWPNHIEQYLIMYLTSLSWVSLISIASRSGGRGPSLDGTRLKQLLTVMSPRSTSNALWEEEDWGMMTRGALSLTSMDRRKLFSANFFMLLAALSAAWEVAAVRADLAAWKLSTNTWRAECMSERLMMMENSQCIHTEQSLKMHMWSEAMCRLRWDSGDKHDNCSRLCS